MKHLNELKPNPTYALFRALTERFELIPAEILAIPTDSHNVGNVGDSLGPPPSRFPFILNSRWTIEDVDYDFSEAEANTVTDELASRSSLQEREQEPKKIKLLERDKEPSLRRSMKRKTYS